MGRILESYDVAGARADCIALFFAENLCYRQALTTGVFRVLEFSQNMHVIFSGAEPVHHLMFITGENHLRLGEQTGDKFWTEIGAVIDKAPIADVARRVGFRHNKFASMLRPEQSH